MLERGTANEAPGAWARRSNVCARPVDDQEPEREAEGADDGGDRERPPQGTGALVVAGGAAHEDPCLVQTAQDRERPEEQHGQSEKRGEDPEADAAREIVGLGADPQARQGNGSPAEQAQDDHPREQNAGEGAVDALSQLATALGQSAKAHRGGAGPASDEQPAVLRWRSDAR